MPRLRPQHFVAGAMVVAALGYLTMAGLRAQWVYYLEVDQVLGQSGRAASPVRVHGTVQDVSTGASGGDARTRFVLRGTHHGMNVEYFGALPDGFRAGGQVVIEGTLQRDDTFHADLVMVKCSSKYEHAQIVSDRTGSGT